MSASPKARLFDSKSEAKSESKLPKQISSRLGPNGKLMSDEAIAKIKEVIRKIAATDEEKYRRYTKIEIEKALGEEELARLKLTHIPYSVYFAKIDEGEGAGEREIFAFINKGVKEFKKYRFEDNYGQLVKQNILGLGTYGKVKILHDLDNPAKCYALKIVEYDPESQEATHMKQAKLLLARFIRDSETHGRKQEELLMPYFQAVNLEEFFLPTRSLMETPPVPLADKIAMQELLSMLRKIFTCTREEIHQFGGIHRDIKPANFLYCPETGVMKLVDFGNAVTPDEKAEGVFQDTCAMGTPGYITIEGATMAKSSQQSDMFSLGVVMGEMIDMIDPSSYRLPPTKLLYTGYKVFTDASDGCRKKIPDEEIRGYVIELFKLLSPRNAVPRPDVVMCENFMINLEKLARLKEQSIDASQHREIIKAQLEEMRKCVIAKPVTFSSISGKKV